jgi:uncharacterized Zn-binding protein involved in type VI secretion
MKHARLGDLVRCNGQLAEVIALGDGRHVTLRFTDRVNCPQCGAREPADVTMIEASPTFQNHVKPVNTISDLSVWDSTDDRCQFVRLDDHGVTLHCHEPGHPSSAHGGHRLCADHRQALEPWADPAPLASMGHTTDEMTTP